jgi:U32 family peptidase
LVRQSAGHLLFFDTTQGDTVELLAPAGNLEKLKWAAAYGADAVYFGATFGSLRSYAGNFSIDDAAEGLSHLHRLGKKGFVTLNIYPWSEEFAEVKRIAGQLDEAGVDALIVADMGVLSELRAMGLKADLHISTQANTTNWQAALAYRELGAKRVNLARELTIDRIRDIQSNLQGRIETEVFVHGAVCFAYSGRCAISDYLTGHGGNRGECKQPCRWRYTLMEEKRPGVYLPYFEDERGSYLFNPKELALFEYIPALAEAGVASVKLEGRMKSIHYIAAAVSFYRRILDGQPMTWQDGMDILGRVPNRGYGTGFMSGAVDIDDYAFDATSSRGESVMVGNVLERRVDGRCVLEIRNTVHAGEPLECLQPNGELSSYNLPKPLQTESGETVERANNSQFILLDSDLPAFSLLRRIEQFQ